MDWRVRVMLLFSPLTRKIKMAAGSSVSTELSEEATGLTTAGLWKGENDSDAEQMEAYDANPLA